MPTDKIFKSCEAPIEKAILLGKCEEHRTNKV